MSAPRGCDIAKFDEDLRNIPHLRCTSKVASKAGVHENLYSKGTQKQLNMQTNV